MKIGEICLLTKDVIGLADFYKRLLNVDNGSHDPIHQVILENETMLTIYDNGAVPSEVSSNILLAFTVEDIDVEYERLKSMGVTILEAPTLRPWGAINLSFLDPDGRVITFRSFPKEN